MASILNTSPCSLVQRQPQGRRLGEAGFLLILFACMALPPIRLRDLDFLIRPELVVLSALVLLYGWLLLAGLARPIRFNAMFLVALSFCAAVLISMIYGADALHHQLVSSDYFEIPKAWLPALYFTVAYESNLSERALKRLLTFMAVPTLFVCVYAWAQRLEWNIAYRLNPYFAGGEHNEASLQVYGRVYSTFGNPNVLGQFLSWMIVLYAAAAIFQVGGHLRNVGIVSICMVTAVLTGSRYALLSTGIGLVVLLFLVAGSPRSATRMAGLLLLIGALASIFVVTQNSSRQTQKRFEELRHPSDVASLRDRLDNLWLEAGNFIASSPIVGHGPAKQIFGSALTDSEYLDVLKQFGFVGFIPYLFYYLWGLHRLRRGLKAGQCLGPFFEGQNPATYLFVRAGLPIVIMALIMNVGMFTYYNWTIMGFLWLLIGLTARAGKTLVDTLQDLSPQYRLSANPSHVNPGTGRT